MKRKRYPRITDRDAKPKPRKLVRWEVVRVFSRTFKEIHTKEARMLNLYLWLNGARVLHVRDEKSRLLAPRDIDWAFFKSSVHVGSALDFRRQKHTLPTCCPCSLPSPESAAHKPERLRHEVVVHVHFHVDNSKKTRRPR